MNNVKQNMTSEQALPEDLDKKLKIRTGIKAGTVPTDQISMNFS